MSLSISDQRDPEDEEQRIGRLIVEAGDPAVAPRPEFVSSLRSLVLDALGPPRRAPRWRPRLVVGSAVAAALAVAAATVTVLLSRPANAWAEVAQALQGKPWVHTRTLGPDGKLYTETWSSVKNGVSASRRGTDVEYHDTTLRIVTKYVPGVGVIYRLRENPELRSPDSDFFQQLLESKGPAKSPMFGMEVVAQSRRDVVEDGRSWVDIELTLKVIGGDRKQTIRFRVDPKTKLPLSSVFQSMEGIGTTLFDYPDRGPADIYDLGVPRTAKLVDRMPSNDLDTVLTGLKAGRIRFDDYRGITDMGGLGVKRVWRKGQKWRAEQLLPNAKKAAQFPRDADASWWKGHQNEYTSIVQAICDGGRVYYYSLEDANFVSDANVPPRPKLSMTQAINPSDDPFMPWPDLFPEYVSHPAVWQPSDERDFVLEPKTDDGPPGTIRLRARDTRFPDQHLPDVYKLWIDPQQNYMALRAETRVVESMAAKPPKIAYVDTKVIKSMARSPGGHLYPTRIVRKTSNFQGEQVWRYHLDFEASLPDEMFQPLKL